jgi:enoyl-CoA hydratase/carnithine racemase
MEVGTLESELSFERKAVPHSLAPPSTTTVLAQRRGGVLLLTLNRPDRLNAWNDAPSSPASMAAIKHQVQRDLDRGFADAVADADDLMHQSFTWPDVREGVASFVEGRPPAFPSLTPRS